MDGSTDCKVLSVEFRNSMFVLLFLLVVIIFRTIRGPEGDQNKTKGSVKHTACILSRGELGDSLGSLRDSVLGELTR